jgi:hypothetical protein
MDVKVGAAVRELSAVFNMKDREEANRFWARTGPSARPDPAVSLGHALTTAAPSD